MPVDVNYVNSLKEGDKFDVEIGVSPHRVMMVADNALVSHTMQPHQYVELTALSVRTRFQKQSMTVVSNQGDGSFQTTKPEFLGVTEVEDQGSVRFVPLAALDAALAIVGYVKAHDLVPAEVWAEKVAALTRQD